MCDVERKQLFRHVVDVQGRNVLDLGGGEFVVVGEFCIGTVTTEIESGGLFFIATTIGPQYLLNMRYCLVVVVPKVSRKKTLPT